MKHGNQQYNAYEHISVNFDSLFTNYTSNLCIFHELHFYINGLNKNTICPIYILSRKHIQYTPTQRSSMTCRILKIFLPLPRLFLELQTFCTTKVAYLTLKGMPSTITDKKWT